MCGLQVPLIIQRVLLCKTMQNVCESLAVVAVLSPHWLMACTLELLDQHQYRMKGRRALQKQRTGKRHVHVTFETHEFQLPQNLGRTQACWKFLTSRFLSARLCVNMYSIDLNCSGSRGRACTAFLSFLSYKKERALADFMLFIFGRLWCHLLCRYQSLPCFAMCLSGFDHLQFWHSVPR